MQSRNPVFARSAEFNESQTVQPNDPSKWHSEKMESGTIDSRRMTIDTVVEKTAITLGVLVVFAGIAWVAIGQVVYGNRYDPSAFQTAYILAIGGALVGFALAMVNSFKKVVSPALVLAYSAIEGLAIGALSKVVVYLVAGGDVSIVFGAVLGTLAAFGGTLAAYKFFDIQVTSRFRKIVIASMFGFVAVTFLDFVLHFFGASFGFNGFGTLGLISSIIGVVIAVFMLILDFDFIERGIAAGLPERESWRAAFGLTVTLVWLYIEILRILAIFARE